MTSLILPVSLDSVRNFRGVFELLGDPSTQKKVLEEPEVNPAVLQVVEMIRDDTFLNQSWTLLKLAQQSPGIPLQPQVEIAALSLWGYIQENYQDGYQLLVQYTGMVTPPPINWETANTASYVSGQASSTFVGDLADYLPVVVSILNSATKTVSG